MEAIDCHLPLSEIYERIEWTPPAVEEKNE
jgi:hypothetical protein